MRLLERTPLGERTAQAEGKPSSTDWNLLVAQKVSAVSGDNAADLLEILDMPDAKALVLRDLCGLTGVDPANVVQELAEEGDRWATLVLKSTQGVRFSIGEVLAKVAQTEERRKPVKCQVDVIDDRGDLTTYEVTRTGMGPLKYKDGNLMLYKMNVNDQWEEYNTIWCGDVDPKTGMPLLDDMEELIVRTDSGCYTGQVLHDETCDCRQQLHDTLDVITKKGKGIVVQIPTQDGRGMGGEFKLATMDLQDALNTNNCDAAGLLSFRGQIDRRTYSGVVAVLQALGIRTGIRINLATNNPGKIDIFDANGYEVANTPVITENAGQIAHHLEAKGLVLGHRYEQFRAFATAVPAQVNGTLQ